VKLSTRSRRILRYSFAVFAALAVVFAARAWDAGAHDVGLRYSAPPGALTVTLYDADGVRLRKTLFGQIERQHDVSLPAGRFTAELAFADGERVTRAFEVVGDGAIEVRWSP